MVNSAKTLSQYINKSKDTLFVCFFFCLLMLHLWYQCMLGLNDHLKQSALENHHCNNCTSWNSKHCLAKLSSIVAIRFTIHQGINTTSSFSSNYWFSMTLMCWYQATFNSNWQRKSNSLISPLFFRVVPVGVHICKP